MHFFFVPSSSESFFFIDISYKCHPIICNGHYKWSKLCLYWELYFLWHINFYVWTFEHKMCKEKKKFVFEQHDTFYCRINFIIKTEKEPFFLNKKMKYNSSPTFCVPLFFIATNLHFHDMILYQLIVIYERFLYHFYYFHISRWPYNFLTAHKWMGIKKKEKK